MNINKKLVFIHRGKLGKNLMENTLPAIIKCISNGYAIEIDIRLLKDNTIILFHDLNLKRLTNVNKNIEHYTYSELKKNKIADKYQIPTLKSVLKIVNGNVPILIDIKGNISNYNLEDELLKLLSDYDGKILIQSFQADSLNYMWKKQKKYSYGLIIINSLHLKLFTKLWIKFRYDFISCNIHSVKNKYLQKLRKYKLLFGWTLTSRSEIEKYKDYCDNFICENIE